MFRTRCAACHTIGGGDGVGPDLLGVTTARSRDWVAKYISAPDKALAAKDPVALALFKKYNKVKMPNLHLTPVDVKLLIEFLDVQSSAQKDAPTPGRPGDTRAEMDSTKTSQAPNRN